MSEEILGSKARNFAGGVGSKAVESEGGAGGVEEGGKTDKVE